MTDADVLIATKAHHKHIDRILDMIARRRALLAELPSRQRLFIEKDIDLLVAKGLHLAELHRGLYPSVYASRN